MPWVPLLPCVKPKKPNPLLANPCAEHSAGILSDVGTADVVNRRKIASRSPDSSLFARSFSTSSSLTVAAGFLPEAPLNSKITDAVLVLDEEGEHSLGVVKKICDPFSGAPNYSYAPENCSKDSIPIGVLPSVLSRFTCYHENTGKCERDGKFIPEASYMMAWAYSCALQDLINIFPDLESLIQCSFVKDTFSNVILHQCRPFRAATRKLWLSVLSLSLFMVVLVLLWVAKAYQDRGRSFSIHSIIPNSHI
ncbi:hypothetical protein U1Q18_011968 [Sarracenia purpurea var. burkii]